MNTNATSATTSEDQDVVVSLSGSDIDGDALTFSLSTNATNGSVMINGSVATYTPNANYNGADSFSFTVSDGELSDSADVSVSVSAVNDAPVLASVSDVSFDEDGSTSISLSADDVDNTDLVFSVSNGTNITATLDGNSVLFSAPDNFYGSEIFTITVSDGALTDSQTISVTVLSVNDAPIVDDEPIIITINEGESVDIPLSVVNNDFYCEDGVDDGCIAETFIFSVDDSGIIKLTNAQKQFFKNPLILQKSQQLEFS